MPQLLDPNFHRTVVLIVHHDENGTFGVVLNRCTEITAPSLCATLEIDWNGAPDESIDWGGPVQPQTGWVLFDDQTRVETSDEVKQLGDGVCFAGSLDVLRRVAEHPPSDLRLMLGYAGWGPGQLDNEIKSNGWLNVAADDELIFGPDLDSKWDRAMEKLGVDPRMLSDTAGHA